MKMNEITDLLDEAAKIAIQESRRAHLAGRSVDGKEWMTLANSCLHKEAIAKRLLERREGNTGENHR